jgi:glycosyltransferase involved in cell wall biosynthesis
MRASFFSTAPLEQLKREQYSISDIKILNELGFKVSIANRYKDIPPKYDLYFSWWASGSIFPLIMAKLNDKPNIVVAGGNEATFYRDSVTRQPLGYLNMPFYKKFATRIVLKYSTAITVVSQQMIPHVKILSGGRTPIVVPNCVDTAAFLPGNEFREYVTTILRIDEEPLRLKRGEIFIKAIPYILRRYPQQKFLVIGHKGNAYHRIKDLIKEIGVSNSVEFTGAISNDRVINYLQRSKVYLQLSDTETFGVAVAEAMSTETPVIVSAQGALPEITKGCALITNHNSIESVANSVLKILDMSDKSRNKLGERGREIILSNYSYEIRKENIRKIINTIIP